MVRLTTPMVVLGVSLAVFTAPAQQEHSNKQHDVFNRFIGIGLRDEKAYDMLSELTRRAPHRLSGSAGADTAVEVTRQLMLRLGCDSVWTEPCMVPHWVRGPVEAVSVLPFKGRRGLLPLSACALGGSVGTPKEGITAEVIEVKSLEEAKALGERAKGRIIFYNRSMDRSKLSTFEAYGGAVDQRSGGASEAAKVGAVAVLVRSMTLATDDTPHTGTLSYLSDVPRIPAAALSVRAANVLSDRLKVDPHARVRLVLSCRTLDDVPSVNVIGEIRGKERPDEIVLVGGHLDCWDEGMGAHDDGSGCIHAIEVLNLFRQLQIAPKRTIRAVMFMNEENGSRGGKAYGEAPARRMEKTIAAIESDRGGFAPRGFTVQADSITFERVLRWRPLFARIAAGRFIKGYSGVDVMSVVEKGAVGFGLDVADDRYFDVHHSANDTIGSVNARELELGAVATAFLCYLISDEGL
jgi:hypothetical protein